MIPSHNKFAVIAFFALLWGAVSPGALAKVPVLSITLANGRSEITAVEGSVIPIKITSSAPVKPVGKFTSLKAFIEVSPKASSKGLTVKDYRDFIKGSSAELLWIPKGQRSSPLAPVILSRDSSKEGTETMVIALVRRDTFYRINPKAARVTIRIVDGGVTTASGVTIKVPSQAQTIRHALLAAANADTVEVAAGVFKERDLRPNGKNITIRGTRSNGALATTIDAENKACHFLVTSGEDRNLVIRDLILTRGSGRGMFNGQAKKNMAGSIHITGSSPTILSNRFLNNSTAFGTDVAPLSAAGGRQAGGLSGGAILVGKHPSLPPGNPMIQGNEFIGNKASANGAAISVLDASAQIEGNTFRNNVANLNGGAVQILSMRDHPSSITGNTFIGNKALGLGPVINSGAGGALSISSGAQQPEGVGILTTIISNTFTSNYCRFAGGAISVFGADCDIVANTIVGNDGGEFGGGVHLETQVKSGGNRDFLVEGNTINSNKCRYIGAGLHNFFEKTATVALVRSNEIIGNKALHPTANLDTVPAADKSTGGGTMGQGGGIGSLGGTATVSIVGNTINKNQADQYAAIWCNEHPVQIFSNTISENVGKLRHSTIFLNRCLAAAFRNNIVRSNKIADVSATASKSRDRGPLYIADVNAPQISGNTFEANRGYFSSVLFLLRTPGAVISGSADSPQVFTLNRCLLAEESDNPQVSSGGTIFTANQDINVIGNTFTGDRWAIFNQDAIGGMNVSGNSFSGQTLGLYRAPGAGFATTASALNAGVSAVHPAGTFAGNTDAP